MTGPLAWEDPSLSWPRRLFSTLLATFLPLRTIHAVADGPLTPALVFAAVSGAPFMLLWAIIPYTHTLLFGPDFKLRVLAHSGPQAMLTDMLSAVGIGFALSVIALLSWALPFTSLVAAFADGSRPESPKLAAWRTTLYRTWIMPLGMTMLFLASWGMAKDAHPLVIELTYICLQILPRILILVHCHTMARYFGASGFGALVVSGVPVAVQMAAHLTVQRAASMLLPMPPG